MTSSLNGRLTLYSMLSSVPPADLLVHRASHYELPASASRTLYFRWECQQESWRWWNEQFPHCVSQPFVNVGRQCRCRSVHLAEPRWKSLTSAAASSFTVMRQAPISALILLEIMSQDDPVPRRRAHRGYAQHLPRRNWFSAASRSAHDSLTVFGNASGA